MAPPHKPRKRFGQNFLTDPLIIHAILTSLQLQTIDRVIEIGPGTGALTKPLLAQLQDLRAAPLTVIELDRDLISGLRRLGTPDHLQIIHQDVLKVCFDAFQSPIRLVGNLPYNISTPLIFHLLSYKSTIQDMHFMFQKEVGLRLCARVGDQHYGRLSVMAQYDYQNELLFEIPPKAFKPIPQVESVFVRLVPHKTPPTVAHNPSLFQQIVADAFNQRRKMISNTLKKYLTLSDFKNLAIEPNLRPEQVSLQQFVQISNFINQSSSNNGSNCLRRLKQQT